MINDIFDRTSRDSGGPIGQYFDEGYGYYMFPRLEGELGPHMTFNGVEMLNWSLNNYLGLANHPEVRKADAEAAAQWGLAYPMGSRMLTGQTRYHEELERRFAEFEKKDFDFVTAINYTGLFLTCKYAAIIMEAQHAADPGAMYDIIAMSSKSGLEGSNKNFAYAGSKFGAIGLVQSFALELAPYNIKVNAICPGNYLDGPLWSDPVRGLFVQYLEAGKVPGAKTVDDVSRFYESKVPMNRGCLPIDVARAVMYCVEQKYETGQAVPVTGGQVMLN